MLKISTEILDQIHAHIEAAYPEEGTGFLLGIEGVTREVTAVITLPNTREETARHNRYLITPDDYLKAELEADRLELTLLGVFHSHPDHPNHPSEYDRDWAQPFFSYIITPVQLGKAVESRAWRLCEDHSAFDEENIVAGK